MEENWQTSTDSVTSFDQEYILFQKIMKLDYFREIPQRNYEENNEVSGLTEIWKRQKNAKFHL